MRPIRYLAKAVIIKNGMLLVTKNKDDVGTFYLFPGGGVYTNTHGGVPYEQ